MAYADEVAADSPVAYWRLGTGATDVNDSSGNGRNLTKVGTVTEVAGLLVGDANTARSLPGNSSNYYEAADNAAFDFLNNAVFTIEAWVNITTADTTFRRILGHENATDGWNLGVRSGTGFFINRIGGSGGSVLGFTPVTSLTGVTYHVVGTYDGTSLHLYVNGVEVAGPDTSTELMGAVANTVRTGAFTGSAFANGVFDELAVYSTRLSAARILAHYNAGIAAVIAADFLLPWEGAGASFSNELGLVPNTALIPRVWEQAGVPGVLNDQSLGYAAGDIWIQSSNTVWVCVNAATGAAVWKKVSL